MHQHSTFVNWRDGPIMATRNPGARGMIRWERLRRLSSDIAAREVELHGTTNLRPGFLEIVRNRGPIDLLINLRLAKEEVEVACAIAHALAHVIAGESAHGAKWQEALQRVQRAMEERMGWSPGTLAQHVTLLEERACSEIRGRKVQKKGRE